MRQIIRAFIFCLGLGGASAALAQDGAGDWAALEGEGVIVLMRHALAPGTGDPAGMRLDDCASQRNLNGAGRDQARRIGQALRDRGLGFDRVWTSQWCRCRETAELLDLGEVVEQPLLNSFFGNRDAGPAQTRALREALAGLPDADRPILVTHQVNITALTGVYPRSGEIVAVGQGADGEIAVLGRMLVAP